MTHLKGDRHARCRAIDPGQKLLWRQLPTHGQFATDALIHGLKACAQLQLRHRQAQQITQPLVEPGQLTILVKNTHPKGHMFQGGADHLGLIVQHPPPRFAFGQHQIGHVGLKDHRAVIRGAVFGNLNPAIPHHMDIKHHMPVPVPFNPARGPGIGVVRPRQVEILRCADHFGIIRKADALFQTRHNVRQKHRKARVVEHQHIVLIKQRKPFAHGLDGIGEVALCHLHFTIGLGQSRIGNVEQIQRIFQIRRALADLILQHRGALKLRVGGAMFV